MKDDYQNKIDKIANHDLCYLIEEFNNLGKNENNLFLKNWQKSCILDAIRSFYIGWFNLCRDDLKRFLEPLENISQDTDNVKRINKKAISISDEQLNHDIRLIIQQSKFR